MHVVGEETGARTVSSPTSKRRPRAGVSYYGYSARFFAAFKNAVNNGCGESGRA